MQNIILNYPVNKIQRIFIAKTSELLYKGSLDSYKLRLHNPKSLIEELVSTCQLTYLTNNDYSQATAAELANILNENNDGLKFSKVNRQYFLELLKSTKKENYSRIVQACRIILQENSNYLEYLFDEIENSLNNFDDTQSDDLIYNEIKKVLLHLNYLFTELINKGYAKNYLYNLFQVLFIYKKDANYGFSERYNEWITLKNRQAENFKVLFSIQSHNFEISQLQKIDPNYLVINKKIRKEFKPIVSQRVYDFLEDNKMSKMIALKVSSLDPFKALEITREKLSKDLDLYHLGHNSLSIDIYDKAAVIGEEDPSKSRTIPVNYQIDAYIDYTENSFERLLNKIKKINSNNIDADSYDKIFSAIRYLRTGGESPELETKLLNYWIGLEYIFTSFNAEEKTIDRIRKYYSTSHSLIYAKRNLLDFHNTLRRHNLDQSITDFDDSLLYLTKNNKYNEIIANTDNELLKFRALYFQKWVQDPSNISTAIRKHSENIRWNLTRLYRIRNEIVHNAAIKNNIHVNISHMKYYLTFILNSILDFMSNDAIDMDGDNKITIDDFFIAQDIMFGSLRSQKLEEYLKVRLPRQILH
ncbi:hypothetical protein EYY60_06140 [Flavobacterium zhairuonense]|uniref:hypothetical protein n=1 Tax=Flavobacterium zhairuonense TaxID=2493631 RepID=UPI00104B6520|nr:hypothetical protein [Flavobacterium zhairuonense]KAF2512686.1 hypothetical protein EYY60_06140 [Flavobacterium zhairuonense]